MSVGRKAGLDQGTMLVDVVSQAIYRPRGHGRNGMRRPAVLLLRLACGETRERTLDQNLVPKRAWCRCA